MAQIFISHSQKDNDFRNFFSNAFAGTKVVPIFEEFEAIFKGGVTTQKVENDIEKSRAMFVVLSQNVQDLPHTRDWVVWEAGRAKSRDIWVFEPQSQLGKISVLIPALRYYVTFDMTDKWLAYVHTIIESYDDSHVLSTVLLGGSAGAALGAALSEKDRGGGAFLGGMLGAAAGAFAASSAKSKGRPLGNQVMCAGCYSSYEVHIPESLNAFRCPVCNEYLVFSNSG
jgi:hypothetical protein